MSEFDFESCSYYPPMFYYHNKCSVCNFRMRCFNHYADKVKFRNYIREEVMKQMD